MAPTSPQPRYSKEEFARRGDEIYERDVLPGLTAADEGKFAPVYGRCPIRTRVSSNCDHISAFSQDNGGDLVKWGCRGAGASSGAWPLRCRYCVVFRW